MSQSRNLSSTAATASDPLIDPFDHEDPVVSLLATRAWGDAGMKSLMKAVAKGNATEDQLNEFQKHIEEITMITRKRQNEVTPLLALPPELYEAILRYVPRPSDLRNVSLACKALSHAAIPLLYHRVHLDLGDPSSVRRRLRKCDELPAGLRYTRHLKITFTNGAPRTLEQRLGWQGVMSVLRRILPRLPHDGLRSLEAPMNVPWDLGTLMILFKSQHKLERLANLSLEPDTVSLLESGYSAKYFGNLRSLDLPHSIGTLEDADFYEAILTDCTQVNRLAVRTQHILDPDRVHDEGSLQNISISYGVLYQALFDRIKPLSLQELCFQEQELEHFSTQLTRAINVEILQFLHLYLCDASDQLLDALAAQNDEGRSPLKLRGFIYEQSWIDENHTESLERFLGSFQGLEYLQIRCGNSVNEYNAGTVFGHKKTLKDLYIGIGVSEDHDEHEQPWQWYLNLDDFRRLSDMQHLRQMALAVPTTSLEIGSFAYRLVSQACSTPAFLANHCIHRTFLVLVQSWRSYAF